MLLRMAKFFYFLLSFSFNHLKQCIIEVQRAIGRLRQNNMHNWHPKEGTLSEKELSQAENIIQRSIQYYHFKQEIKILSMLEGNDSQFQDCRSARKRNSIVILNCNLHKLDSFIDKEGLLRVGGWLKSVTSSYAIKHPFILPKGGHMTVLLIHQFHHEKQHHQGYGMTHDAICQAGYYIINGHSAVSHFITKCIMCRWLCGVTPAPPFTYTGIDVFGPFYIKGLKEMKWWGQIFTCLSSRAIHLETLNSMATD